jgi:hypothetical protein
VSTRHFEREGGGLTAAANTKRRRAGGTGIFEGLSPLEIEAARLGWVTKKFPDELRRLQYLESLSDRLARAGQLLLGYQTKLADQSLVRAARAWSKVASDAILAATA